MDLFSKLDPDSLIQLILLIGFIFITSVVVYWRNSEDMAMFVRGYVILLTWTFIHLSILLFFTAVVPAFFPLLARLERDGLKTVKAITNMMWIEYIVVSSILLYTGWGSTLLYTFCFLCLLFNMVILELRKIELLKNCKIVERVITEILTSRPTTTTNAGPRHQNSVPAANNPILQILITPVADPELQRLIPFRDDPAFRSLILMVASNPAHMKQFKLVAEAQEQGATTYGSIQNL
ncbi:hypothetical protein EDD21DRAFT_369976 [Dissophora ornata]|nr:hypothetical protein EDD21DRAFT_369976 [Dissophora ornata]